MLTTTDASKVSQNVVTDVNANIEVAPSRAKMISHDAAILFDKSVIARPLAVPEVGSIQVKNTEYRYRWVNRNGLMYQRRKAQGFVNATTADVNILGGEITADKGEIVAYDVILMKIRADLYDGAMKFNMQKAAAMTAARGMYLDGASSDVNSDSVPKRMSVANEAFTKTGKAVPFIPTNTDQIISESISSGRVEEARATVDALRANAKKEK